VGITGGDMGNCRICNQESKELKHLSIYVFGSEGISIWLNCRMAVTEFVRQLCSVVSVTKKVSYKAAIALNKKTP